MIKMTSLVVSLEGEKMAKKWDRVVSVDSVGLVVSGVDSDLHSTTMISSIMAEVLVPLHSVQAISVEDLVVLRNQ